MKLRCDRAELVERLNTIQGIVSVNSPKPILGDFFLSAQSDALVAEATDLEISGRVFIHKVETDETGELAVPSARLLSIVKEIPEDFVEIMSVAGSQDAELRSRGFEFKILGHDPSEFPCAREGEDSHTLSLPRNKLYESLKRVSVAMSHDPTRYQLNGVFVEVGDGRLTFTATDGKRLTHDYFNIEKEKCGNLEISAIIPNRTTDVFLKVLASPHNQLNEMDTVDLLVSETQVSLRTKDTLIRSSKIEGTYPSYQSALPPKAKARAKAKRGDLLTAARSASLTTDKETSTVLFRMTPEVLVVESNARNIGASKIELPIELTGDTVDIRFNPVYFIEALRTFDEDDIFLELTTPDKPVILRGCQNYRHLVMPLVTT